MDPVRHLADIPPHHGFPGGSVVENPPAKAGDAGSVPGSGRSPIEEDSNPFQYSCLGNLMDRGVWWAVVQGVAKSYTRLSHQTTIVTAPLHIRDLVGVAASEAGTL